MASAGREQYGLLHLAAARPQRTEDRADLFNLDAQNVVVLLSGGLDSATALAMARAEGLHCHALSIDYGQRHRAELDAARAVASQLGAAAHTIVPLDLRAIGGSALTDPGIAVPEAPTDGIPVTYVPARNTLLLALALGLAEVARAGRIVIGVNALDYSGYPELPGRQPRPRLRALRLLPPARPRLPSRRPAGPHPLRLTQRPGAGPAAGVLLSRAAPSYT